MSQTLCYKSILLLHQLQICLLQFRWLILSSDIRNSNEQGHTSFWNLLPRIPCFCPGYQSREASGFPSRYAAFLTMGKEVRQDSEHAQIKASLVATCKETQIYNHKPERIMTALFITLLLLTEDLSSQLLLPALKERKKIALFLYCHCTCFTDTQPKDTA